MAPRLSTSTRAFQKVLATKNNHLNPHVRLPLALPASLQRPYATQDSLPSTTPTATPRRKVTIANDDGRIKWGNLNRSEKAARTTQQTFNFSIIIVGIVMTVWDLHSQANWEQKLTDRKGAVITLFYTEVLAPNSKTNQFNAAVNRIKASSQCTDLLGSSKKITAFGEPTWNKWARARPIA